MLLRTGLILVLGTNALQAQEVGQGQDIAALMQTLPEKTLKKLRSAPDAFLQDAAGLIYGFGTEGSIDAAGIDAFVAVERARVRAAAMERYLAADLDNDGDIARGEMVILATAAAAGKRGALYLGFDLADADSDAVLTHGELRNHAQSEAMDKMSDADAEILQGFMMFDLDGDGLVAMKEVVSGVRAMVERA